MSTIGHLSQHSRGGQRGHGRCFSLTFNGLCEQAEQAGDSVDGVGWECTCMCAVFRHRNTDQEFLALRYASQPPHRSAMTPTRGPWLSLLALARALEFCSGVSVPGVFLFPPSGPSWPQMAHLSPSSHLTCPILHTDPP